MKLCDIGEYQPRTMHNFKQYKRVNQLVGILHRLEYSLTRNTTTDETVGSACFDCCDCVYGQGIDALSFFYRLKSRHGCSVIDMIDVLL